MGTIISAIEEKLREQRYKEQKAYLVALASCIREVEPGSVKHNEILWVIKNQDKIRMCRKIIESIESVGCEHKNQTQHFSDVFGAYNSCLDCKKDL